MTTAPKVLALKEIEPPSALAEALSSEFLRPLRIENPPPVRLARRPAGATWGGFCSWQDMAEFREVTIHFDAPLGQESWVMVEKLRGTYLHEIAHRFLSKLPVDEIGGSHGPVFFALQLLLFLRAGEREGGRPWAWHADLYDLHDCFGDHPCTPGQALDWAFCQAAELADTEISAESAAGEIARRFAIWREAMALAPAKRQAAHAARAEREAVLVRKATHVKWWICYSIMLGAMAGLLAGLLAA